MWRRKVVLLLWLVASIAALGSTANARIVGVVFDDSGSMASRINLPAFGVQLLASTLDVRSGKDRLLTLRLSQSAGGVIEESVVSPDALQHTVDRIRSTWARTGGGTPYGPIELMLEAMVRQLRPEERGTLLILTDGQFEGRLDVSSMKQRFETLKRELDAKGASIDVEFILIAVGPQRAVIRRAVRKQRVRETLIAQFNGNRRNADGSLVGDHEVTDIRGLFSVVKKVVARVSDTDVQRMGTYIGYSGNTVNVRTPLSISRIISIATAISAAPPSLRGHPFKPSGVFSIGSRMGQADRSLPNKVFRGQTEHMVFKPALPPGRYSIAYDRPVADSVFLLFETNAKVELSVLDSNGAELQRDSSNAYVLVRNRDYRLIGVLVDETDQGRRVVPLSALSGWTQFSAIIDEANASRRVLPMAVSLTENRASVRLRPERIGAIVARSQAQFDGFVSPISNPIQIKVVEGSLTIRSSIEPARPCPDCRPNMIRSILSHDGPTVPMGTVRIDPRGDAPASAILDTSGLPAGLSLQSEGGAPLAKGATVELKPGQPISFRLFRVGRPPPEVIGEPVPFKLRLHGPRIEGSEHVVEGTVHIAAPKARLRHLGANGTVGSDGRLSVTGSDLNEAKSSLAFKLDGALEPTRAADFRVASPAWLFGARIDLSDDGLRVTPQTHYWCMCFLWLERGTHDLSVFFVSRDGLQKARRSVSFDVDPTWREILFGCLVLLGIVIAAVWLIGALVNTWMARRFPREAFMEIDEGQQLPRTVVMRGRNWTFLRALLWPILGRPDERRILEGLDLTAGGRLSLHVSRDAEDVNVRGEWLSDRFSLNEKLERLVLQLNWQETVQKEGPPLVSIRCWKSAGDRIREP